MPMITCVGADHQPRTFHCTFVDTGLPQKRRDYRVETIPAHPTGEAFDFAVEDLNPKAVRVVMMIHHHIPDYSAKGIPEAMISFVARELGKTVVSSPTGSLGSDVWRSPDATKVWDRLVQRGHATYDAQSDVYTYTGP